MSDVMRPIPFHQLMDWILGEYRTGRTVFGVAKPVRHSPDEPCRPLFGERLEAPFGPAAGPHTQLCQNIIAAYVSGCRFFELKTVQTMDGRKLAACVKKPCITAPDEAYNCEWSTELTVGEAFDEYVKAWFACKLLARELELGSPDGFVFNMSVGYTFEGITSTKIDDYIEGLKDASATAVWQECVRWTAENLDRFRLVDRAYLDGLSPRVCRSITLSTLHGCPPQEIERIAAYLLDEKGLNTYVKCNPTLLGYDFARATLDGLGYDYMAFDDHHFKEDLQFADAVPMFRRLLDKAAGHGLEFGVKLTNTFPVDVAAGELPSEEMYMSGRALHPLSLEVARRLGEAFGGVLRVSYSGGADVTNIRGLVDVGIWPVTMATTVLKPGGYQRFAQIATLFSPCDVPFTGLDMPALTRLAEASRSDAHYRKAIKPLPHRKLAAKLPLLDCFTAPCRSGCPIGQDIPAYLRLAGQGDYETALDLIVERNPLPFITGTICPHRCTDTCVRSGYDESVHIRQVKLDAATKAHAGLMARIKEANPVPAGEPVAVVGGGPAGIAAASLLARAGVPVTVFERADRLGGVVARVIPPFRISQSAIQQDIDMARAWGARFRTGVEVTSIDELASQGFSKTILAIGAWRHDPLELDGGTALNAIDFLMALRENPEALRLGRSVVVVGAGNTAMDTARAAQKAPGVERVSIVYRRTRRYMPADEEELIMALDDGVQFLELLSPVAIEGGDLVCRRMELGAPDISGRRSPVETGETVRVPADTVIASLGEAVDDSFYRANGIDVDAEGRPVVDGATMATSRGGVYAIGDGRRGAATAVEAIADALVATSAITGVSFERFAGANAAPCETSARDKKGRLDCGASCPSHGCSSAVQGERCLECPTVCELCADVCPNRANVALRLPGVTMPQIVHVDGMCNECGNCATFCPYEGRPYKDKFTLFWTDEDFAESDNAGFLPLSSGAYRVRLGGLVGEYRLGDGRLPEAIDRLIAGLMGSRGYMARH